MSETAQPERLDMDALLRAGWAYRDFSKWVRGTTFNWLLEQIGQDNVKILAMTKRTDWPDGPWMRAQILISENGRMRLAAADLSTAPGLDREGSKQ